MNCPRCGDQMKVTHTYTVPGGSLKRSVCKGCDCVVTVESLIVAVDPSYGEGAAAIAKRRLSQAREPETGPRRRDESSGRSGQR